MVMNWFFHKIKTTNFWIFAIFITFLYVALLLRLEYFYKDFPEPFPVMLEVTEQTKRLASHVDVGMHIKTFPHFSITSGLFVVDAIVWFRFDKATEALDTLENFTIQNSQLLDSQAKMHRSKPIVKVLGDQVLVVYNIQVKFQSSLKYKKFPLGDHRLNIVLVNESVTQQELVFTTKSTHVTFSDDIMVDDWKPVKTYARSGYVRSMLDKNDPTLSIDCPSVAFSIDCRRHGYRSLTSLYLPLFVLFLIGLLTMMITIFDITRLGIISASLPMLVLYRLVVDASAPQVAYATHIDFVYYSLVLLSLPILVLQMYIMLEGQKFTKSADDMLRHESKIFLEKVNNVVFLLTLVSLVMLMTYNFFR